MKILIIKSVGPLSRNGGVKKIHLDKIKSVSENLDVQVIDPEDLRNHLKDTDIIISSRFLQINLNDAPKLKWIHLTSAGINNLPENIKESDILVTNSSGVHPIPISEHVLACMLMFSRQLHISVRNQLKKEWARELVGIDELAGKTVTIVGLGHIGSRLAKICKALEMNVWGVVRDQNKRAQNVDRLVGSLQLDELLAESDFVVDCLPATDETRGLFNLERFQKI